MRECRDCGLQANTEEELSLFKKTKHCLHGRSNLCKKCEYANSKARMSPEEWDAEKERKSQWRANNPNYPKEWINKNRDMWLQKHSAYQAKRRAVKKQAVASWYDDDEVKYIYKLAQERGLHVDHIVPLQHKDVCGLHVQDNLRCIPKELNLWKSNKLLKGVRNGF